MKPIAIIRPCSEGWEAVREDNGELIRSHQTTDATPAEMKRIKLEIMRVVSKEYNIRIA